MSRLATANLPNEIHNAEESNHHQTRGPVLVRNHRESTADWVTRRVIEAVDGQLANGSMPA